MCVTKVTLPACLPTSQRTLPVVTRVSSPGIHAPHTHVARAFNIQYLHHRDPRFRARDIHSAVCARAKDRYLRIRPITYVCRRTVVKSRPSRRRDLLFIRLGRSLFECSASTSYVVCRQVLWNRSHAVHTRGRNR